MHSCNAGACFGDKLLECAVAKVPKNGTGSLVGILRKAAFDFRVNVRLNHEKQTGSGIARHVDVRPTIFIKVGRDYRHAITWRSPINAGTLTHIRESTIAVVAIKGMLSGQ